MVCLDHIPRALGIWYFEVPMAAARYRVRSGPGKRTFLLHPGHTASKDGLLILVKPKVSWFLWFGHREIFLAWTRIKKYHSHLLAVRSRGNPSYHESRAETGEHTGPEQKAAGELGTQVLGGAGKRLQGQQGAREGGPGMRNSLRIHFRVHWKQPPWSGIIAMGPRVKINLLQGSGETENILPIKIKTLLQEYNSIIAIKVGEESGGGGSEQGQQDKVRAS